MGRVWPRCRASWAAAQYLVSPKEIGVTVEAPSKAPEPSQVVASVGSASVASSTSHQTTQPELAAPQPRGPAASQFHARWDEFARFSNFWEGHVLAGLLRSEDVPAKVIFLWPVFDAGFSLVLVPRELLHRARWVLSWPAASGAELTFLATGELELSQESDGNMSSRRDR